MAEGSNRGLSASQKGCDPVAVNSITYIGALAAFLIALKVPGIKLPYFPATGCLIEGPSGSSFVQNGDVEYLFLALWCVHFFRRTVEVLFVHDYKRKMTITETLGAPIYYWFFAFWVGISLRHDNNYKQTFLPMAIVGCVLFFIGEVGNCICHLKLRAFRKEKRDGFISSNSKHVLPYGFLFEYVSCPHYFFEIISWLGFLLASWVLSVTVFLVATILTLLTYSYKKHKAYLLEFDGLAGRELYPRKRKALIPFIF